MMLLMLLMLILRVRLEVMGSRGLLKVRSITLGEMERSLLEPEILVVDEILAEIVL